MSDIQGKAAKELQKFLFGSKMTLKFGNPEEQASLYPVPSHTSTFDSELFVLWLIFSHLVEIFKDLRKHHRERNRDEKKYVRGKRRSLRKTIKGFKGLISDDDNNSGYSEMESPANSPAGQSFGTGRGRSYVDDVMYEERRVEVINKAVLRSGAAFSESIQEERKVTTTKTPVAKKNGKVSLSLQYHCKYLTYTFIHSAPILQTTKDQIQRYYCERNACFTPNISFSHQNLTCKKRKAGQSDKSSNQVCVIP